VQASNVPADFASFFIKQDTSGHVFVAGDSLGQILEIRINYDSFQIINNEKNIELLTGYLASFDFEEEYVDQLISKLTKGVKNDTECQGQLSLCVLNATKNQPRFIYDFDNTSVKIFTSLQDLKLSSSVKSYHNKKRKNNAIINWLNLNIYSDLNSQNNLSVNNDTHIGLPVGALFFDTQYHSQTKKFETYTAIYDAEFTGYRVQIGRHRYNLEFNTTDFLTNNGNFTGDSIHWGTSASLMKGKSNQYQAIDFIAPQNALVQIYRKERLILSRTVSKGENSIQYSELPTGSYDINLILRVGNNEVINETRFIVNTQDYALSVGERDFVISSGFLPDHHVDESALKANNAFNHAYVRAAFSQRLNESNILAISVTSNQKNHMLQFGSKSSLSGDWAVNFFNSISDNNNYYHQFRLSHQGFYLDTQLNYRDSNEDSADLMGHLYGNKSYRSVGGGWSGKLYAGSVFARYHVQSYSANTQFDQVQRKLSLGWSKAFNEHHISFNLDYKKGDIDEMTSYLSWSYQFDEKTNIQSATVIDETGFRNNVASVGYNASNAQWHNQSSIGGFVDNNDNQYVEFTNSITGSSSKFNTNSYIYASSASNESASLSISGSQIITTNSIDFSHHKSKAFIKVSQNKAQQINLAILQDDEFKKIESVNQIHKIIPVDAYQDLTIKADGSAHNTYIKSGNLSEFIHPATLPELTVEASKLISDIVVLTHENGNSVEWVQCETQICSVEPLSQDGVFRVNYLFTELKPNYQLTTPQGSCRLNPININTSYRTGFCL